MFFKKNTAIITVLIGLLISAQLNAQQPGFLNWRINAGVGYGTYFGDVSRYRIKNFSDWRNAKYLFAYNKNYVQSPSYHLSLEKKFSNRSGVIFSGNYTDISASDRYLSNDGKLRTDSPNFSRALNFRTKIYDVGVGYKLKSNEKAFIAPYLWLGGGVSFFNTYGDLYDSAGRAYTYASPTVMPDGIYETNLRNQLTETDAPYRKMAPYANIGVGLAVKLSHALAIGIESDIKYSFSDYIDDVSGTYKSSYATPQQAYAAKPGTNIINPASPVRGNDDGVNDFYIQNRLVLKYNFFAAAKKRKSSRGSFNAPYIYPDYYPEYKSGGSRFGRDSVSKDSVLVKKLSRQSGTLDSVLDKQNNELTRLNATYDSLSKRVDTLDRKLRMTEQKNEADAVNRKLDSLQQLINNLDRKSKKTTADTLRMRVYQLQADSIKNEAVKNGIEWNSLHAVSAGNALASEAANNTGVVRSAGDDREISAQQKQTDSLMAVNNRKADSLNRLQNARADSIQQRLDSLLRLQQRTPSDTVGKTGNNRAVEKDTVVVSRMVTVKDTIAQQRLEALNDKMQRLSNNNDSLKNTLDYLYLQQDATQIQITNDSLRLQALRQQQADPVPTPERKRKWYEVFKKKNKRIKNAAQQDETAMQINTLERELNDLRNRNAALERQMQNTPRVVERYYETNANNTERRRYNDLEDELRELNRQLGRERRYTPVTPVVPARQTDNADLQREINQLRDELQQLKRTEVQNVPQRITDTTTTQADSSAVKLNQVTRALDSLNRELAALKQQTREPAPAKTPANATTSIYFNSGSVVASAAQRTKLTALRNSIKANDAISIELKAFTDATGNMQVNEALSRKRATYVKNYLVQHYGIPAENISVELNPSNKAAGGISNPLDRRVDVIVTSKQ